MTTPVYKHQAITVKEIAVKQNKKGETYYAVKTDKGATFNFAEKLGIQKVGDLLTVEYSETEYEYQGKKVSSRWVNRLLDPNEGFDAIVNEAKDSTMPSNHSTMPQVERTASARVSDSPNTAKALIMQSAVKLVIHNATGELVKKEDVKLVYEELLKII